MFSNKGSAKAHKIMHNVHVIFLKCGTSIGNFSQHLGSKGTTMSKARVLNEPGAKHQDTNTS